MEKIICRQTNACSTDESRGGEGEGEEGGGRREDTGGPDCRGQGCHTGQVH